ncbi:hypothetical protein L195_g042943, partial [Trifolium pratense]
AKLQHGSVLYTEFMGMIIAPENTSIHCWNNIWLESDCKVALSAITNMDIVPWTLRNRWSNCFSLGLNISTSREGNSCVDKLANHGHRLLSLTWWDLLPICVRSEFLKDKMRLPSYRFHK